MTAKARPSTLWTRLVHVKPSRRRRMGDPNHHGRRDAVDRLHDAAIDPPRKPPNTPTPRDPGAVLRKINEIIFVWSYSVKRIPERSQGSPRSPRSPSLSRLRGPPSAEGSDLHPSPGVRMVGASQWPRVVCQKPWIRTQTPALVASRRSAPASRVSPLFSLQGPTYTLHPVTDLP